MRIVADQVGAPTSARLIADAVATMVASGPTPLAARMAAADGLVHLAAAGTTTWHGFADAIVAGLGARNMVVSAERVLPIVTSDYPTKAMRPANSRLDLTRLRTVFGIDPAPWDIALAPELDRYCADAAGTQSARPSLLRHRFGSLPVFGRR